MTDRLEKRYIYKLSANLIGFCISIFTQAIIPRGLGPKAYGDFNFLSNFFTQATGLLDTGTSTCFYTKLSQRPKEQPLIVFYMYFVCTVSLLVMAFVFFFNLKMGPSLLWPGQEITYVYLAAGLGISVWVAGLINQQADAFGITVLTEKLRILQKVVALLFVFVLFSIHQLNLLIFFLYNYLILILFATLLLWAFKRQGFGFSLRARLTRDLTTSYFKEFYNYSKPLFFYSLACFVASVFDRWLLQIFGGSEQQGFYGLSFQIAAVCFLFASAMTPLLMREFAVAFGRGDFEQMAFLFRRYIPVLYSVCAFFCCFTAMEAEKIVFIMGGKAYNAATAALRILSFYPLHQTYGQLSNSVFLATGKTGGVYRNASVAFMLGGIPLSYFLLAPRTKMGLGAGAPGLAFKMVLIQVLLNNVLLYFNTRMLKLSFWKFMGHQFVSVVALLILAYSSVRVIDSFLSPGRHLIINFIAAGTVYAILSLISVSLKPSLIGMRRRDVEGVINYARSFFRYRTLT
jgi:O-antigen/teichoic acid export membrane protein